MTREELLAEIAKAVAETKRWPKWMQDTRLWKTPEEPPS